MYPNGRPLLGPTAIVGDQATPIRLDQGVSATDLVTELASELSPSGVAYLPIVDDTSGSSLLNRVVGFGYVSGVQPGTNGGISFTVGSVGNLAVQNASATLGVTLPAVFADPTSGSALTTKLFTGYTAISNSVLAPALVNHHIGPNPSSP